MARLFRLHNCDIFLPSQFGLFPPKINYVHCGHFQGSNKVQPDNPADSRNNGQKPAQSHLPVATFSQLRSQCFWREGRRRRRYVHKRWWNYLESTLGSLDQDIEEIILHLLLLHFCFVHFNIFICFECQVIIGSLFVPDNIGSEKRKYG